ncbi:spermatogenesis-associated serine-rich protein 1 [Canis lupus dingo]|uniref:spermatogenesis-associated serine-rich protein 1 n=1 Tax=Canis lupus dingo TaxID=286419 RepID=UPI0020C48681|nr:spermatogenesis-associated serine-rich protein 1 [Canis lupus dingo]
MHAGSSPRDYHLPSICRATRSRELEKVQEKRDSDMTVVEKRYSVSHQQTVSELRLTWSSWVSSRKGLHESVGDECKTVGVLNTVIFWNLRDALPTQHPLAESLAADLDLKSSSHSVHSSETSLPEDLKDKYPEEFSLLKLQTKDGHRPEWTFYPRFSSNIHTYHVGKQCFFNGVFLGNRRSLSERIVDKCFGRKKYDIDPRNGIPTLTPGDNPYMYPEQSKDFHKTGSTLPPVNFSIVPYEKKYDTFIPLEPLPQIPTLPFWVKEKANRLKNEIREVEELDNWQPASPLIHNLLPAGSLDSPRQP